MDFRIKGSRKQFCIGSAAAGDFPDSPDDGWATALAYREHVLRVVARLKEDPGAQVQVAEVDGKGRRLRAWVAGDESVRPSVLAAIRKALGHEPRGKSGRCMRDRPWLEGPETGLARLEQQQVLMQVVPTGSFAWEQSYVTALFKMGQTLRACLRSCCIQYDNNGSGSCVTSPVLPGASCTAVLHIPCGVFSFGLYIAGHLYRKAPDLIARALQSVLLLVQNTLAPFLPQAGPRSIRTSLKVQGSAARRRSSSCTNGLQKSLFALALQHSVTSPTAPRTAGPRRWRTGSTCCGLWHG